MKSGPNRKNLREIVGTNNGSQSHMRTNGLDGQEVHHKFTEKLPTKQTGEFKIKLIPGLIAVEIPKVPKTSIILSDAAKQEMQAEMYRNGMTAFKVTAVPEGSRFSVGEYVYMDLRNAGFTKWNVRGHLFYTIDDSAISFAEGDPEAYEQYIKEIHEAREKIAKVELPPEKETPSNSDEVASSKEVEQD